MLNKIFDYINDNKIKITLFDKKLDIINYKKIIIVDDNKIKIDCDEFLLTIKGNNLSINRLYDEELLIEGKIKELLLGDYDV